MIVESQVLIIISYYKNYFILQKLLHYLQNYKYKLKWQYVTKTHTCHISLSLLHKKAQAIKLRYILDN